MANRCPTCNKFAPLQTEIEDPDGVKYDPDTGVVSGSVRVYRTAECCGDEMTENVFDFEAVAGVDADRKDGDEYDVEIDSCEVTESGGGRYAKNMIGFELIGRVIRRRVGKNGRRTEKEIGTFDASDNAPASHFEELT